jgi:hypothetical protein
MSEHMSAAEYQAQGFPGRKSKVTPETALKTAVKQYLSLQGWSHWYHLQSSFGVYPGLPDIEAIKDGRVVFIETKSKDGKLSPGQKKFRDMIEAAGGTYLVVREIEDLYVLGDERQMVMGRT